MGNQPGFRMHTLAMLKSVLSTITARAALGTFEFGRFNEKRIRSQKYNVTQLCCNSKEKGGGGGWIMRVAVPPTWSVQLQPNAISVDLILSHG